MYSLQSAKVWPGQMRPYAICQWLYQTLVALIVMIGLLLSPSWATAQVYSQLKPLVIRNDRGGLLDTRLRQLHTLRESGRPVMITGRVCYSTCTMLIGLPQTCVSPKTTFGFHGPSSYGRRLSPDRFEWASNVIAHYYPPALKQWYLAEGRHKIIGLHRISGAQLIAMGVKQC